jgi:predicted esterase
MDYSENTVTYTSKNSYATSNTLTDQTKNVWLVLHGIGYLSRYFLKYFDELPPEENYIIAPQAPSKYYLNNQYHHVGASWLTKVDTERETENVLTYLDAVLAAESIPSKCHLIIFGFSQGVSIATRWIAQRQLYCHQLIVYAGGIPSELRPSDFEFLLAKNTRVICIVGNKDEYLTETRRNEEFKKIKELFDGKAQQIIFDGGHEIKKEIVNQLIT